MVFGAKGAEGDPKPQMFNLRLATAATPHHPCAMHRLACVDGQLLAPEEAKVSVYDRGFLYGDSVFETIRTYGGRPFALDEHVRRLERSSELVGIQLPSLHPHSQKRSSGLSSLGATPKVTYA
jgi:hypothetical protein